MKKIILFAIFFPVITLVLLHFSSPPPVQLVPFSEIPELTTPEEVPQESSQAPEDNLKLRLSATIRRGKTIYESLVSAGISSQKTYSLVRALKSVFNPRKSKPGDLLKLKEHPEGRLVFEYYPDSFKYYVVEESEKGTFSAYERKVPIREILMGAKITLQSSVYESMRKQGIDSALIYRFTDIFVWEIDFLSDPRKGDTFRLIWKRYLSPEGKVLMEGEILAAQYVNAGRVYTAMYFEQEENRSDYYTPEGKSMRRSFLRSPLNYRRISSGFSWSRLHPILRIYRPHLGIDYAAPIGTPIWAVAEGTIIFAGWNGGFGRYVKIKHAGGITTSYGHLSGYARGIRKGVKVKQGQTIGYVGSTGLSTGPHLDFRVTRNGRYVNFLQTKFPTADPVDSKYIDEFKATTQKYLSYLSILSEYSENIYTFP